MEVLERLQVHKAPHLKDYFLVATPLGPTLILGGYVLFVFKLGPFLMKDRKPFDLRKTLLVYNWAQIVLNSLVFLIGTVEIVRQRPSPLCFPLDNTPDALYNAKLVYCYYLTKIVDLLDTVFFVFRKKYNQVTFLHIYHHILMVLMSYLACVFKPGGANTYMGYINVFVHIVMYYYYYLATWNPSRSLWLKKYITRIQLVQHIAITIMFSCNMRSSCSFSKSWAFFGALQGMIMFYLFLDFYLKTYKKSKEAQT